MNFELGKEYIVKVSENGIIPIDEFKSERFFDKDSDDLDFLTDEEKQIVIKATLKELKNELYDKIKDLQETHDWGKIGGVELVIDTINEKIEGDKE